MGSVNTTIHIAGIGIVLCEPTVAIVQKAKKLELRFAGAAAQKMLGKTSVGAEVVYPVAEGVVVKPDAAVLMLRYFLNKVISAGMIKQKLRALVSCSCGLSLADRRALESVYMAAGLSEVILIDTPLALMQNVADNNAFFVDIGGGTSEIAAVNESTGIIKGYSLNIGGLTIDNMITDYMAEKCGLKIGRQTAEKIKNTVGSLYENDISEFTVNGKDLVSGAPATADITAAALRESIRDLIDKIIDVTRAVLKLVPPDMIMEINKRGIYLCGGVSKLAGLSEYFCNALNLKIKSLDATAAVNGLSVLAQDKAKLGRLLSLEKI